MAAKKASPKARAPKIESNFTKGDKVVRVIIGGGARTCTTGWRVKSITKDGVVIEDNNGEESRCLYDPMIGREIDAPIPGFTSEIIVEET